MNIQIHALPTEGSVDYPISFFFKKCPCGPLCRAIRPSRLEKSRRPCPVANSGHPPQKWPAPPWKVDGSFRWTQRLNLLLVTAVVWFSWPSGSRRGPAINFFFVFATLEPRVEWYESLWASNTSPPRNCFTFLQSSCSLREKLCRRSAAAIISLTVQIF